ncbi:MAG: hypothetical protein V5A25_10590 [Halovenus sp.]
MIENVQPCASSEYDEPYVDTFVQPRMVGSVVADFTNEALEALYLDIYEALFLCKIAQLGELGHCEEILLV